MFFKDIQGEEQLKERLLNAAQTGRVPHALLFSGPEGTPMLPVALAFAHYLLCKKRDGSDSCGVCPSCVKMRSYVHPDLHFVFPVVKKDSKPATSDRYLPEWRDFLLNTPAYTYDAWLGRLSSDRKQAQIYAEEGDSIIQKYRLTSVEDGYRVMIIWQAEKMNITCANSILKLLEEPPAKTLFILISHSPDLLLDTIRSRTQLMEFKPSAQFVPEEESAEYLEHFSQFMRLCYSRRLKDIKIWSDTMAKNSRDWQKKFFSYCQRMIRENFMLNFHRPELNCMTETEKSFSAKFAPFVNERNIWGLMNEIERAEKDIEQNVNAKMVFFDLSLKVIVLLK